MISSVDLFFEDSYQDYSVLKMSELRRRIRNTCNNPLELPDHLFISYFRLNKDAFVYVLNQIKDNFHSTRTSAISPCIKLACALRFFASGSYQNCVGNDFDLGLSQATVSVVMSEVIDMLEAKICPAWIKTDMPQIEKQDARNYFFRTARLPGVIGCVDGTHIGIVAPIQLRHQYLNRKGYFSLNAMIACDHRMNIRYIDARYPGSTHDSFVWNCSELKEFLERWYQNGELSMYLGDSGYPLLPYLLTPFRNANSESREARFNRLHLKARNIVERTIGVLKSRFRCLLNERKLHYTPRKATKIVNVYCALHNICRSYNVEEPKTPGEENSTTQDLDEPFNSEMNNTTLESVRRRNEILASL